MAITDLDLEKGQAFNVLAFVLHNKIKNENDMPIEFRRHSFMIDPYLDNSPQQVAAKCSQIGWSVEAIIKAIHLCKYYDANVIYTLPSKSVVKDFVIPKVNPIIENNPALNALVGSTDSTALKRIGNRFLYFRGSWEQTAAISISGHILMNDEVDRSNPKVLKTYRTRLDAARDERPDLGWEIQFSNPSIPGAGVDELWQISDQKHWFIRCPHCNLLQYLDFPENIDFERQIYICRKCHKHLPDEARSTGEWVYKRKSAISGYWISQLMAPWIPAKKIIEDSQGDQSIFYNFTLGKPYISKETSVTRDIIVSCLSPGDNPRINNAMGVDNGVTKHYVIGNVYGIFKVGTTTSWDEIEDLRNRYNASMVIDANPYPNTPKKLAEAYRGKVWIHYYIEDLKRLGIIRWGEHDKRGVVEADRTKIFDLVVAELNSQDITFNLTATELEEYITQWGQMYRTVEETTKGIRKAVWKTIEGRADHYAHATVYWRVALEKAALSGGIVKPPPVRREGDHPEVDAEGNVPALDIREVIHRAAKGRRDWRLR